MKYAINTGGRKIRVEDKDLQNLIQKGFIEISESEYMGTEAYNPKLDTNPKKETSKNILKKERSSFRTWIV